MPGLRKFGNITLKRGIVNGDNQFFKWLSTVKLNTVERRDLIISLLERGAPAGDGLEGDATPSRSRSKGRGLKATGNEVAIESMELAHEGLELQNE